jgi:ribonuclease J
MAPGTLRVVALGGIGEIGRNMTVLEIDGRLLVIDCGVLFPEDHHPGVDVILPDFEYLRGRLDAIEAVVLTHGHEDHIGGVPYLLKERQDIPLIASGLTMAMLRAKLSGPLAAALHAEVVREKQALQRGPFSLEFFAVNHSIPDALAVAVRTEAGTVLHTGDFKMDQTPLDGRKTDLGAFYRLGDEGVDLLLSDSTNAEVPGFVTSEKRIGPVLDHVIENAPGRVIISCTSSHVHRIQQILQAAQKHERQVALIGRSMVRNTSVARDVGLLDVPAQVLVDVKELGELPGRHQLLICTGSQGEPMSALTRMAWAGHPTVTPDASDTVVLASSMIPGNESAIWRLVNQLSSMGVTVIHKENADVHTTGHAPAGELLYVLNAVRPRNFVPVHGEPRHLRAHALLAREAGVPEERIFVVRDGVVIDLQRGVAQVTGRVEAGHVFVDGDEIGEVGEETLRDRRTLRDEGVVTITVVVEGVSGKIIAGPELGARGLSDRQPDFAEVTRRIEDAIAEAAANGALVEDDVRRIVKRIVGRWLNRDRRRHSMILATVLVV